jgi:hypothetical protein
MVALISYDRNTQTKYDLALAYLHRTFFLRSEVSTIENILKFKNPIRVLQVFFSLTF